MGTSETIIDKVAKVVKGHEAAFRLPRTHGVKISIGTDAEMFSNSATTFRSMLPMDAILTATHNEAWLE